MIPACPTVKIDFDTDLASRPTPAMRAAMAAAEVGDEHIGEDPTVNRLLERSARLLGKPAAVLLPTVTMANQVAIAVQCRPGDEMLLDVTAHPWHAEGGATAALSGVTMRPITGDSGLFNSAQLASALRTGGRFRERTAMVSVEQTADPYAGRCWPLPLITEVTTVAREHDLATHLDGARLFNASVATGVEAKQFAAGFDSVCFSLTKALGAPFGAVLAGDTEFIEAAWRVKQRWGAGLAQAGIMAAAGLHALDNHLDRIAEDHTNAKAFAERIAAMDHIALDPADVETNIVRFDVTHPLLDAPALVARLIDEHGIRLRALAATTVRAVTHIDIARTDVDTAADAIESLLRTAV